MTGLSIILLVVGFSLIVLVHEFGHFIAARYVGIRVEQFALGFGQALFSWRRGLGLRVGSTEKEYNARIRERALQYLGAERQTQGKTEPSAAEYQRAEKELGLGDTEYRFNWVPLGGYVKMMGQDDTKPGLVVNDPRSYTSKTVGQRMLVISAGVIMNVIFAAIAFMILFLAGMRVPAPVVGFVTPMSPAQLAVDEKGEPAPLRPGDRILTIDGRHEHDFGKVQLSTALARQGEPLHVQVQRTDGSVQTVLVTPAQAGVGGLRLLQIGITPAQLLEGPELTSRRLKKEYAEIPDKDKGLRPGERITAIAGKSVTPEQFWLLDAAVQEAAGKPVSVTIVDGNGASREAQVTSSLIPPFGDMALLFAGMQPRAKVESLTKTSAVEGKLKTGDIVTEISVSGDARRDPTVDEVRARTLQAGAQGEPITIKILRDGKILSFTGLRANVRLDSGPGLGVQLGSEFDDPIVGGVEKGSPAAIIPIGSRIARINGSAVKSWGEVLNHIRSANPGDALQVEATLPSGAAQTFSLRLRDQDVNLARSLRFIPDLVLDPYMIVRKTSSPLTAAAWGVTETRDSVLQVYVTLRRLFQGSVPLKGMMGPVGLAQAGVRVANDGADRLLWFLAIISANLAVVNFLPIPVVDGGHFLFLLIEKIQGKPVSERTMVIAQWIGLVLIGSVFILVTYQDILRLLTVQ